MTPINQVSFGNQLRSATMQDFLAPQAYADKNAPNYVPSSYSNYTPPEIVQDEGVTFTTGLVRTVLAAAALLGAVTLGRKYLPAMKNLDLTKPVGEIEGKLNKVLYYPAKIGEWTLEKSAKLKNWAVEKWNNFRKKDSKPPETPSTEVTSSETPANVTPAQKAESGATPTAPKTEAPKTEPPKTEAPKAPETPPADATAQS